MQFKAIFFLLFVTQVFAAKAIIEVNEKFVENVLRQMFSNPTIAVMNMSTAPAAKKGMSFIGDVRRVSVRFSKNDSRTVGNTSLIIKQSLLQKEGLALSNNEISLMSDVLVKMNQSLKNEVLPVPRLFYCRKEHPSFLVIEDLEPLGYRAINHREGLDFNHSVLAMDAIAKFHAASISVLEQDPQILTQWWKGAEDVRLQINAGENVRKLTDIMKTWGEKAAMYADEVSQSNDNIINRTYEILKPKKNGFNVLVHDDYSWRNMLFKYNSNHPVSSMIVDFQSCHFASPVIDLWYFFSTSLNNEIDIQDIFHLIKRYHGTLKSTMEAIGTRTEVISLKQLESDMIEAFVLYFFWTVTILPANVIEEHHITSIEEMIPYTQQHPEVLYNEKYRRIFMKRLQLFKLVSLFKK